jgi:hypothetical protein
MLYRSNSKPDWDDSHNYGWQHLVSLSLYLYVLALGFFLGFAVARRSLHSPDRQLAEKASPMASQDDAMMGEGEQSAGGAGNSGLEQNSAESPTGETISKRAALPLAPHRSPPDTGQVTMASTERRLQEGRSELTGAPSSVEGTAQGFSRPYDRFVDPALAWRIGDADAGVSSERAAALVKESDSWSRRLHEELNRPYPSVPVAVVLRDGDLRDRHAPGGGVLRVGAMEDARLRLGIDLPRKFPTIRPDIRAHADSVYSYVSQARGSRVAWYWRRRVLDMEDRLEAEFLRRYVATGDEFGARYLTLAKLPWPRFRSPSPGDTPLAPAAVVARR